MSTRSAAAWVVAFALLVLLSTELIETDGGHEGGPVATTKDAPSGSAARMPARTVRVLRVVDGDTIVVRGDDGRSERVRYIGVDTPESVKPDTPVQCFGKEAAAANRRLVAGREVRLTFDREAEDRYRRMLAFVHVGSTFVNAELLRGGYARTIEIAPNTSRAAEFSQLQRAARRAGRGLWGACRD